MYLSAPLLLFFNSAPCWLVWARHNHKLVLLRECQRKWGHPPYTQHVRCSFLLPILVDVAIACEFDGASSSLQRALNDVVPDLIGHCCDVQIHEKLRNALKLLHGEFSHFKNRNNNTDSFFVNHTVSCSEVNRLTPLLYQLGGSSRHQGGSSHVY